MYSHSTTFGDQLSIIDFNPLYSVMRTDGFWPSLRNVVCELLNASSNSLQVLLILVCNSLRLSVISLSSLLILPSTYSTMEVVMRRSATMEEKLLDFTILTIASAVSVYRRNTRSTRTISTATTVDVLEGFLHTR